MSSIARVYLTINGCLYIFFNVISLLGRSFKVVKMIFIAFVFVGIQRQCAAQDFQRFVLREQAVEQIGEIEARRLESRDRRPP